MDNGWPINVFYFAVILNKMNESTSITAFQEPYLQEECHAASPDPWLLWLSLFHWNWWQLCSCDSILWFWSHLLSIKDEDFSIGEIAFFSLDTNFKQSTILKILNILSSVSKVEEYLLSYVMFVREKLAQLVGWFSAKDIMPSGTF